jgi:hypothetical protein
MYDMNIFSVDVLLKMPKWKNIFGAWRRLVNLILLVRKLRKLAA